MKIAVCGSGTLTEKTVSVKAKMVGAQIAKQKALLLTGACGGYPHAAAAGSYEIGGIVMGISPAKNKGDHTFIYKFPTDVFTEIEYTGMGIPLRNVPLVKEADAIIIIGGQIGTLNEFSLAFQQGKTIGVLQKSGKVANIIEIIVDECFKSEEEKHNVIYSESPEELVRMVIAKLQNKGK